MKRFAHLYEKICDMNNLKKAHNAAKRGKAFYKEVKMIDSAPEFYLGQIRHMLLTHTYKVSAYTTKIKKERGKVRMLHKLPYYPDRIIQHAILQQIEFIFKRSFCYHSCASVSDAGTRRARILSKRFASLSGDKGAFCLKIDIEKFFDNVRHDILKRQLERKIKDKELLALLEQIITSFPENKGLPIGSYLSQYFANFYLTDFDHWLKEQHHQKYVVRFMDDVVIFGADKKALHELLREIASYLYATLRLKLNKKWQVFPVNVRGVDFVGYRFFKDFVLLRKSTIKKIKSTFALIKTQQKRHTLINTSSFCAFNSYAGFLKHCDGYRFFAKHFMPLMSVMANFYLNQLCPKYDGYERQKKTLAYVYKVFGEHCNNANFNPKALNIA